MVAVATYKPVDAPNGLCASRWKLAHSDLAIYRSHKYPNGISGNKQTMKSIVVAEVKSRVARYGLQRHGLWRGVLRACAKCAAGHDWQRPDPLFTARLRFLATAMATVYEPGARGLARVRAAWRARARAVAHFFLKI
jgi:hypothetical protein